MNNFIVKRQPKSYNSWILSSGSGKKYVNDIQSAHSLFNPRHDVLDGDLYGLVYYFHKKNTGTDADNISKPIWDCLSQYLYKDDKQVKYRVAGCFDLTKNDFSLINLSNMREDIAGELLEALLDEEEKYVIYVECGNLNYSFFKFNIEL